MAFYFLITTITTKWLINETHYAQVSLYWCMTSQNADDKSECLSRQC